MWEYAVGGIVGLGVLAALSVRTVRPDERGLIERFGKYHRFAEPGLVILIPLIDSIIKVDITEDMVDAKQQEVITKDRLNAVVDAQIYFKVKEDEASVKKSQYAVSNYFVQITALARTTMRAIIGTLNLTEANSEREKINDTLATMLNKETAKWGIEVVRTELKELTPPQEIQSVMNEVVAAENKKKAAIDFATATETKADGEKRAKIKEAEGQKQNEILVAEGHAAAITKVASAEAERIKLVNTAARKNFTGSAVLLKRLETAQAVLENNTKLIVPAGSDLINIVGETAGVPIVPVRGKK